MAGYVIAEIEVTNPERFREYQAGVVATIEAHGGRFLVRGGGIEVKEGGWQPKRLVVIEFPSIEQARAWYGSPEYERLILIRQEASRGNVLLVEGTS